jgi:hypothetical protein
VGVLYAAALSEVDGEPRQRALERLEKLPPPPPYDAAVSDFFWRLAMERYAEYRGTLVATFTNLYATIVASSSPNKAADGVRALTRNLARVLLPLGRAYAARPDRDEFADELTELMTTVRLMTNNTILMEPPHAPGWADAIRTLGDHPIALYVRGRLLASRDSRPHAAWSEDRVEELRTLSKEMFSKIQKAHRTDHVRALALHFVEKVLFDDANPTTLYKGAPDDAIPFLEFAGDSEAWANIASCRKAANDLAGEAQAIERYRIKAEAHEDLPGWLMNSEKWVVHQTHDRP